MTKRNNRAQTESDQAWLKNRDDLDQPYRELLKLNASIEACRRNFVARAIEVEIALTRKFNEVLYTIDTNRANLMMNYRRTEIEERAAQLKRLAP